MNIGAITMVHKEESFLKLWVRHYEKIVGRENMYVVTHGDQPQLQPIIQGCNHVFIPRKKIDVHFASMKSAFLNTYANILFHNGYDCVIGGDVDELVFADPDIYPGGLSSLIKDSSKLGPALTTVGLNICETDNDRSLDINRKVFAQRNTAFVNSNMCKPLILLKRPARWTLGFHETKYEPVLVDGLYMAHLKYVSKDIILNEVSPIRKETADSHDELSQSKYKHVRVYWGETARVFESTQEMIKAANITDLDSKIDDIRNLLRSNRVENAANRGGISFRLPHGKKYTLTMPKRFSDIL